MPSKISQRLLESLLEMRWSKRRSAIGQFFPFLVTVPQVFAYVNSAPKARKYVFLIKTKLMRVLNCSVYK